jgi:cell division protein FtsW
MEQELADTYYVLRQGTGVAIGVVVMVICAFIPYSVWSRLSWPLLLISIGSLVLLVVPWTESIAPSINGSRRWLRIGITVQPSEFAKIAIVVWTAGMAVKKASQFRSLRQGLAPFLVAWALLVLPIALEPDFSTALLIGLLGLIIIFSAGARISHFVFLGLVLAPIIYWQLVGEGFRVKRLLAWADPASDPAGAGFQAYQSLLALGSGGLTGVGIGQGRQRFGFLPEAHNDFIFSMIGEQWGLIGVLVLLMMYVALVLVGFRIASRAPDLFGELLALGFTSLIALQALLHMAVGLSLLPTTGLALPLVSYGRSNLIVTLASLGILVSVARMAPGIKAARA